MTTNPYTQKGARAAAFHVVLFRIPAQIATLLGYVVLVRWLPETEYGVYGLFCAMLPMVGTLLSFGMENTLSRYQPEYLRRGENRLANRLVRKIALLRLAITGLFLATVLLFWSDIAPFFKVAQYREQFVLFALLMLTHFQCQILNLSLSAHLLHKYSAGLTAAFSIFKLAGYALVFMLHMFTLRTAIIVDLLAYLLFYLSLKYAYKVKPDHRKGEHVTLPSEEKKRLIRYAAYYSFNGVATLGIDGRKDNFFIAAWMDTLSVGAFAFAQRFDEMLGRVSPVHLLESLVQPLFVSLDYKNDPQRIHRYFSLLISVALGMRLPLFAFTAAYHREIVQVIFDGRFLDYSYLLAVTAMFSLGIVIGTPVTLVAQLQEKAHFVLASKIFGVYAIAASLLLIPVMGVLGAVIAGGTAVSMKVFVHLVLRARSRAVEERRAILDARRPVWGGFALAVLLQRVWIDGHPALELGAGLLIWSGFFLLQIRAAAGPDERRIVGNLFSGRERKLLRLIGVA